MSAPRETIGHSSGVFIPGVPRRGQIIVAPPIKPKAPSSSEALAIALYAEWWKKRYPSARLYPWEQMRVTCPRESEAWLAVADMAILNLCS